MLTMGDHPWARADGAKVRDECLSGHRTAAVNPNSNQK